MQLSEIKNKLTEFYDDKVERVGFILHSGEIVEVDNVFEKPEEGFDVSAEDLIKYEGLISGTWHTHPGTDSNLSVGDYESFLSWPELEHFIVGTDGVSRFIIEKGDVLVG